MKVTKMHRSIVGLKYGNYTLPVIIIEIDSYDEPDDSVLYFNTYFTSNEKLKSFFSGAVGVCSIFGKKYSEMIAEGKISSDYNDSITTLWNESIVNYNSSYLVQLRAGVDSGKRNTTYYWPRDPACCVTPLLIFHDNITDVYYCGSGTSSTPISGGSNSFSTPILTLTYDSVDALTSVVFSLGIPYMTIDFSEAAYVTRGFMSTSGFDIADFAILPSNIVEHIKNSKKFDTDPYKKGGNTTKQGGSGDFDATSEAVSIPDLPTLSATDTGFITLFNPTSSELKNLANYMWSNPLFDLSAWKKIFADPMDAVLGLSIVPVEVPDAGSGTVTVGNISTGISMNKAGAQYVSVDCGTLNVNEYWGAYLDYSPYTKIEIYLPYIGTHPLDIDDVMGKAVHVVYHVDILSGACTAYVQCGDSVLYSFIGQCSSSIPITGTDWTNVINGTISIAASIGTMVATGGASAPFAATAIASTATNSLKPTVEKSGAMGGTGGLLGIQTPYLILTRPRQALPENQNTFTGYPSFITSTLSNLSGYTEIESCHLQGIPATEQELNEIENLLKKGVII